MVSKPLGRTEHGSRPLDADWAERMASACLSTSKKSGGVEMDRHIPAKSMGRSLAILAKKTSTSVSSATIGCAGNFAHANRNTRHVGNVGV